MQEEIKETKMQTPNGNNKYKKPKCNPQKLEDLVDLRKQANLNQGDVAGFFGMSDYGSVAAWEQGKSKPFPARRQRFIVYLLDKLLLRRDREKFGLLWQDIMVEEWGWEPLSDEEWRYAFPGQALVTSSVPVDQPTRVGHYIDDRGADLAQLGRLLADLQLMVYRLLGESAGLIPYIPDISSEVRQQRG